MRSSCEHFCASCAQLLARLVCSIIRTMPLPCTSTSWLIYKLVFCKHPQYTMRICIHFLCTLVFTSFVNSANAYLVHMVAVRSGDLGQVLVQPSNNQTLSPMHWWALVWPVTIALMAGAAAFCKSALCPRLGSALVGIRCWSNLGHLLHDVYVGWSYIVFNKEIQPDFSFKCTAGKYV